MPDKEQNGLPMLPIVELAKAWYEEGQHGSNPWNWKIPTVLHLLPLLTIPPEIF